MTVDGKEIANRMYDEIRTELKIANRTLVLGIIVCAPNFETEKYLSLKQKKAREVGIEIALVRLEATATTAEVLEALVLLIQKSDGVVVQLPLPVHIDANAVLSALPPTHDVDALNPNTTEVLSPVVGAIAEILKVHAVPIFKRHVTVIGSGKLVGIPASKWFMEHGASVSIVTKDTTDISYYTKHADIIVSGAGVPNLITGEMIKDGAVILDAGTSEDGGVLKGDVHTDCESKASLFTPVPGGIGPITIAVLLRNVVKLSQ